MANSSFTGKTGSDSTWATTLDTLGTRRKKKQKLGECRKETAIRPLELKMCDLAMGSAAFLVETCRQLAEKLMEAYEYHGLLTQLPPDLEPLLYARRLVAQRCLYGVDRNPFAVNLAKLSLWLITLDLLRKSK